MEAPCASCARNIVTKPIASAQGVVAPNTPAQKQKAEVVNLKFGKVRVTIKNAQHVQVSEDNKSMVLVLTQESTPVSVHHQE